MDILKWYKMRSSNLNKKDSDQAITQPTSKILDKIIKISKAIKEDDLLFLENNNNKDYDKYIDSTFHEANNNITSDNYRKLKDPNFVSVKSLSEQQTKGLSPKRIFEVNGSKIMMKPYHTTNRDLFPFSGFGIMTAHSLFSSANLSHLIENVGVDKINNSLMTVHEFEKDFSLVSEKARELPGRTEILDPANLQPKPKRSKKYLERENPENIEINNNINFNKNGHNYRSNKTFRLPEHLFSPNPLHARQIGVMDYLLGNGDRHGNNLLISNNIDDNNFHSLKAIDHDQIFHYHKYDNPFSSYTESVLAQAIGDLAATEHNEKIDDQLFDWWTKNKTNIMSTMNRNLDFIKNDDLRRYVRKNFTNRYNIVDKWAENYINKKTSLFQQNEEYNHKYESLLNISSKEAKQYLANILKNKQKTSNIFTLLLKDGLLKDNFRANHLDKTAAIQYLRSNDFQNNDIIDFFVETNNPKYTNKNFLKSSLLSYMTTSETIGQYVNVIKRLLTIDQKNKDNKILNPQWTQYLTEILKKQGVSI